MATVVGGVGLSHSSFMVSNPGMVPDEQADRAFSAYARARDHVRALRPEALVLLGTDHFNSFFLDNLPQFCVGAAERYQGCRDNMPELAAIGNAELGGDIVRGLLSSRFDPALSYELKLDHSFFSPLYFLTPDFDVPIVPVVTNTITEPLPSPDRSYELGTALRAAIESSSACDRVAVIGSGGLSHWPGMADHGRVNEEFDAEFLTHFIAGDVRWLRGLTTDGLFQNAGNGGQEIRNWLALRACLPGEPVQVEFYEAIHGWLGGWAVATLGARAGRPVGAAAGAAGRDG